MGILPEKQPLIYDNTAIAMKCACAVHRAKCCTFANMAQKGGQSADLPAWYADLNRCGQKQEYDKAIKLAGRSKWIRMPVRLLRSGLSAPVCLDYYCHMVAPTTALDSHTHTHSHYHSATDSD